MSTSESASEPTILDKIYAQRVQDVETAKNTPGTTWNDLQAAVSFAPPLISFPDRLRVGAADGGVALMAEIKRASPSKGDIDLEVVAPVQARTYALAGASVVSVLTEPTWFKGSLLDMRLARAAVDSLPDRPAILRKDFVFDMYQILEARVHGADTVLLIVAMLSPDDLTELYQFSQGLGMEPLVEVNNADEMAFALELGARVIGVNNRDLKTFAVDMGTTSRLADLVVEAGNPDTLLCALSGISGPQDVQKYAQEGVNAVLVGEALMRTDDINHFVRQLLSLSAPPMETPSLKTRVKVDGVTPENVNDERVRSADLVGVLLSKKNPKHISLEDAAKVSVALQANAHPAADLPPVPGEDWFAAHARRISAAGRPLLVGILDDDPHLTLDEIIRAVHAARLDAVQLASSTPVEWARHVPALVLRSIFAQSVLAGGVLEGLRQLGYHHAVIVRGRASGYVHELRELSDAGIPLLVLAESTSQEVREGIRPWAICSQL
ncbi:IGPS-domain-containing protein [Peniophora sp. CONT]|nr:IGPS-domain-containing protein [Peniophora sp. CONT]